MRGLSWIILPAVLTLVGCTGPYSGTQIDGQSSSSVDDALTAQPGASDAVAASRTSGWQPLGVRPQMAEGTWLEGDFGRTGPFSQQPSSIDTSFTSDGARVTLHATGLHGWTMMSLRLPGVLGEGDLVPGNTVYLNGDATGETDVVVDGSVNGCTGPSSSQPTMDETTDDVVVTFSEDGDGNLVLDVASDYSDGSMLDGTLVFR